MDAAFSFPLALPAFQISKMPATAPTLPDKIMTGDKLE